MLEKAHPISVRVPKSLRDELLRLSAKNRRSLSSYCRIIIEDNYRNYRRNHRYDILHYKDENFVPVSFAITETLKNKIIAYIISFRRNYYSEVTFSAFIRKVLSDSEKH